LERFNFEDDDFIGDWGEEEEEDESEDLFSEQDEGEGDGYMSEDLLPNDENDDEDENEDEIPTTPDYLILTPWSPTLQAEVDAWMQRLESPEVYPTMYPPVITVVNC